MAGPLQATSEYHGSNAGSSVWFGGHVVTGVFSGLNGTYDVGICARRDLTTPIAADFTVERVNVIVQKL